MRKGLNVKEVKEGDRKDLAVLGTEGRSEEGSESDGD